jgi:citrate lyase beta subunit
VDVERVRTWLFAPADVPDRCRKAYRSAADQVIWDLEDGVAAEHKDEARAHVLALLDEVRDEARRPWIRVNGLTEARGREDLERLWSALPSGRRRFVVPKVDRDSLAVVAPLAAEAEWLLVVETARGLWDVWRGAPAELGIGATARCSFGALDFQLDLGGTTGMDEAELLVPRSLLAFASRSQGLLAPIDAVWTDVGDEAGLRASAERARRLGFVGKLLIHPRQIAPVVEVFRPSAEEVAWAERVVAAAGSGVGAVLVDGAMVDRPVVERARAILASAGEREAE